MVRVWGWRTLRWLIGRAVGWVEPTIEGQTVAMFHPNGGSGRFHPPYVCPSLPR